MGRASFYKGEPYRKQSWVVVGLGNYLAREMLLSLELKQLDNQEKMNRQLF